MRLGKRAADLGREDADTLLVRSQAYALCGLSDKAVPLLERILELDPGNGGAHWFLVLADVWAGRYREAIDAGDAYFRRFDEDPEIHNMMGWAFHSLGELEPARLHYERAHELFGGDSTLYELLSLGALYKQSGKPEEARRVLLGGVAILERRLNAHPDNYRMRAILAMFCCYLGDRKRLRREEAMLPEENLSGEGNAELAMAYSALGETQRAIEILRLATARGNYTCLRTLQFLVKPYGGEALRASPEYPALLKELKEINARLRAQY